MDEPPKTALEAIAGRRTARRFDPDRPLADEALLALIRLATLAPSPANLQPWRFLVVRDPRNRRKLRGCTFGEARITDAPAVLVVLAYLDPDRSDLEAVIAAQVEAGAIPPGQAARLRSEVPRAWARSPDAAIKAAMLAAGTLMIAAEGSGVASAWIEDLDREAARSAFGIPDDHEVCGLIALGFAADPPPFPGRFGVDHVAFDEHFGLPWPPADRPG